MLWRVLVLWPAKAVDLWWTGYKYLLMLAAMAGVTAALLVMVLAAFGIRWGW